MTLAVKKQALIRGGKTDVRTHEPTGVVVHFRRLGHMELTRMAFNFEGRVGDMIAELSRHGHGVSRWEGVVDESGQPVGYTAEALDAVVAACPDFGRWFNRELLEATGLRSMDGSDAEGNAEVPAPGSGAGSTETSTPSA